MRSMLEAIFLAASISAVMFVLGPNEISLWVAVGLAAFSPAIGEANARRLPREEYRAWGLGCLYILIGLAFGSLGAIGMALVGSEPMSRYALWQLLLSCGAVGVLLARAKPVRADAAVSEAG